MPIYIIMIVCILLLLFIVRSSFKYPAKTKSAARIRGLVIVILIGIIVVCAIRQFGPRGKNSLFAKPGEGTETGSDLQQSYANGLTGQKDTDNLQIVVSQNTVEINGKHFSGKKGEYDGLEDYLRKAVQGVGTVYVKDDFAVSGTYHYVIGLLEKYEVDYVEETQQ